MDLTVTWKKFSQPFFITFDFISTSFFLTLSKQLPANDGSDVLKFHVKLLWKHVRWRTIFVNWWTFCFFQVVWYRISKQIILTQLAITYSKSGKIMLKFLKKQLRWTFFQLIVRLILLAAVFFRTFNVILSLFFLTMNMWWPAG